MRRTFPISVLTLAVLTTGLFPGISAQSPADKAQQLIKQSVEALGGESLRSLKSLSVTASCRRQIGENQLTGEVQLDLLQPDKIMRTETLSPLPGAEITQIDAVDGDEVWSDQRSNGAGGLMIVRRPVGDAPHGQARPHQGVLADLTRFTIGLILSTLPSFPVEYSYAGEAEAPDGKADALDVKGPQGFTARLFLDRQTHRPLMLAYQGKRPRVVTRTGPRQGPLPQQEELDKQLKEEMAAAAKRPDVEFQIRFSDYRQVDGVFFPHHLSRAIEGEVHEELEITRIKVNPSFKADKFKKR
jgi:hypothetical protein